LERNRTYNGRRSVSHRRRSASTYSNNDKSSRRGIKLFICAGLFVIAAVTKLLFPSAIEAVGDKINSVVNYRAALTVLGQGISGEKKFTTALGEAFSYAFTGETPSSTENDDQALTEDAAALDAAALNTDESAEVISEIDDAATVTDASAEEAKTVFSEDKSAVIPDSAQASVEDSDEDALSKAIIAAFMESQEEYSDYAIPAGVSYDMPKIGIAYKEPVSGEVSSPFGYRIHQVDKTVKFHYGTDIAAKAGTPVTAFADGKVLSSGESATLGKFVILYHGAVETQYAHCASINVTNGQTVEKGEKIATVGDTGNATQACLHFELKVNGQYVNPEYYIQWK
jgi:murein DD-endopeptidase MepM/ murein hydrolase activator NlpD